MEHDGDNLKNSQRVIGVVKCYSQECKQAKVGIKWNIVEVSGTMKTLPSACPHPRAVERREKVQENCKASKW